MSELGPIYRVLRPWVRAYMRFDHRLERARSSLALFAEGFVLTAFDRREQSDLTIAIYDDRNQHADGVPAWEAAWWEEALPPPPAWILVGAAGLGREAAALRARGYDVDAFEPAPCALPALAGAVSPGLALTGSYQDLIRAQAGEPSALAPLVKRHYDAVLLGWGSLSHVLEPAERRALFEACAALCPTGPILASFLSRDDAGPRGGRARRLGVRLGSAIARAPGSEVSDTRQEWFLPHAGVLHGFDREELELLGRSIRRVLELDPAIYPHATWRAP